MIYTQNCVICGEHAPEKRRVIIKGGIAHTFCESCCENILVDALEAKVDDISIPLEDIARIEPDDRDDIWDTLMNVASVKDVLNDRYSIACLGYYGYTQDTCPEVGGRCTVMYTEEDIACGCEERCPDEHLCKIVSASIHGIHPCIDCRFLDLVCGKMECRKSGDRIVDITTPHKCEDFKPELYK